MFDKGLRRGLTVGLSGVSCGGKTTVTKLLQASFPWASVLHQDTYFHPPDSRLHVIVPELNHCNWDLKSALDFKKMEQDLAEIVRKSCTNDFGLERGEDKARFFPNDQFVNKHRPTDATVNYVKSRFSHIPLTIIEGHIIFNHKPFYDLCQSRYFFTLDKEECLRRRQHRVYDPPNPPGYFEKCVWPLYSQRLKEIQKLPGIAYMDAKNVPLIQIFNQIFSGTIPALESISTNAPMIETESDISENDLREPTLAKTDSTSTNPCYSIELKRAESGA